MYMKGTVARYNLILSNFRGAVCLLRITFINFNKQEIVPGVFLGPYSAAMKTKVNISDH